MAPRRRLVTPRFAVVVGAGLAYFLALGTTLPVVPVYVEDELGGGGVAVGIAVGALFLAAVLVRPFAGRFGDRVGRRRLIIGGALVVGGSIACYGLVESLAWLVFTRAVTGLGEAVFFVGAATMATDLAPVERRGEALSYWSIAVYGGTSFGPVIGEVVLGDDRYGAVWLTAAVFGVVAALLGLATREVVQPTGEAAAGPVWHRAAIGPGLVLFSGLIALAGFLAFVPLYADDLGLDGARGVLLLYGVLILVVRVFGARLPDTLGGYRAGLGALVLGAAGTTVMAVWGTVAGLVVGTVIFAMGMSLMYPSLMLLALTGVPDRERASVVGTFSSFFDASQFVGALVCGTAAALFGPRGAFAAGAVCAVLGLVYLRAAAGLRARAAAAAGA